MIMYDYQLHRFIYNRSRPQEEFEYFNYDNVSHFFWIAKPFAMKIVSILSVRHYQTEYCVGCFTRFFFKVKA